MRTVLQATVGLLVAFIVIVGAVVSGGVTVLMVDAGSGSSTGDLGAISGPAVPGLWRLIEKQAASSCPAVPWTVLGALGFEVSGSGRRPLLSPPPWWPAPEGPFGVVPMLRPHGPSALVTAADRAESVLCEAVGASGSLGAALAAATGSGATAQTILVLAGALSSVPSLSAGRAGVVVFASAALGLPYLWGGNGPGAYDCSGLVVAAFRSVGVALPRTAQAQFDVSIPASPQPTPGDLVFFGSGPSDVGHVGIVIYPGLMIDAPHTGAFVRIESYGWSELLARRAA